MSREKVFLEKNFIRSQKRVRSNYIWKFSYFDIRINIRKIAGSISANKTTNYFYYIGLCVYVFSASLCCLYIWCFDLCIFLRECICWRVYFLISMCCWIAYEMSYCVYFACKYDLIFII